jgi:(R)-benzylsuccinyl-CoA dehydrogenase
MEFALTWEQQALKNLVRDFVESELMPLERTVIAREASLGLGDADLLTPEETARLNARARELGLWGINLPTEYGGQGLGMLALCLAEEELAKTITPYLFPPDAPNLDFLLACANEDQKERYLLPYARGEKISAIAATEPGAGSDVAAMQTTAVRDGDEWVINGTKIFISRAKRADFFIVMAVTDPVKRNRGGITAFLVDQGTPGLVVGRPIPTMTADMRPYEVYLNNVRVPDSQVLGEVGGGFVPMSNRFGVRRLEFGARCVGMAQRMLDAMIQQANTRVTFGQPLADRQMVQAMIADSAMELQQARLLVYYTAWKADQGLGNPRLETSMVKVAATEMAQRVADRCIQIFGGMGLTKDWPWEWMYRKIRGFRIIEGPSEIHRWQISRFLTRGTASLDLPTAR